MKNYKKDFPIFRQKINGYPLTYLDSAATSQKPQIVIDAITNYYQTYNANVRRALYPLADRATQKVEEVRKLVGQFINAKHAEEIIFVRNTTEAINLVMNTWGDENVSSWDTVTTTIMEHHSNFVPWQFLVQSKDAQFEVVDIDENGLFNLEDLYKKTKHAKFLTITHVSNVLGTINPIRDIIKHIRLQNKDIRILIDAAQSVPHMNIDVQELDCDFLAFSGHKMMAGTGIGVLYGKKKLLEEMEPFLFGGEMIREVKLKETTFAHTPFKFEAGTPDITGIISLGVAIEYIYSIGINTIQKHKKRLIEYTLSKLQNIKNVQVYGPRLISQRGGLISFTIDGIHPHDIAQVLGDEGVCIRAGHHCAQPLHTRLGVPATARASFYIYNDEKDVDRLIEGIKKVQKVFHHS